jgi:hypothetical protein
MLFAGCQSMNQPEPDPGRQALIAQFKRIDQAGAGRITYDQAIAYYRGRFKVHDRDSNGFLEGAELPAAGEDVNAASPSEVLRRFDRNGDGRISPEEFLVHVNGMFQLATQSNVLTLEDVQNNIPGVPPEKTNNRDLLRPAGKKGM